MVIKCRKEKFKIVIKLEKVKILKVGQSSLVVKTKKYTYKESSITIVSLLFLVFSFGKSVFLSFSSDSQLLTKDIVF